MQNIKNFLSAFDMFQKPVTLFFLSKPMISTNLSILCSLVVYTMLLLSFFRSDVFYKQNPKISDTTLDYESSIIKLNNKNFGLNLWFWDDWGYYSIDPTYINVEVIQNYWDASISQYLNESIPLRNCTKEDLDDFEGGLCLTKDLNLNSTSEMYYGNYSFLSISLKYCSNKTSNVTCKPLSDLRDYVHGKFFTLTYNEYTFNLKNYESPTKMNNGNTRDVIINKDLYQFFTFSLMQVNIFQDASFLFNNGEILYGQYHQQDPTKYFSEIFMKDPTVIKEIEDEESAAWYLETLVEFHFFPNRSKREITRKYETVIDALSSMGGLATFLKFFGMAISKLAISSKILRELQKNHYGVKKKPKKFSTRQVIKEHPKFHLNDTNLSRAMMMSMRNQQDIEMEIKENQKGLPRKNEPEHNNINSPNLNNNGRFSENENYEQENNSENQKKSNDEFITFCNYFKYIVRKCCRVKFKRKEKIIEQIEKSYIEDFDIITILKNISHIEKLKAILLDDKQRSLFDILGKKLPANSEKKEEEIIKYFEEKNKECKFTDIDIRLWEFYQQNQS